MNIEHIVLIGFVGIQAIDYIVKYDSYNNISKPIIRDFIDEGKISEESGKEILKNLRKRRYLPFPIDLMLK